MTQPKRARQTSRGRVYEWRRPGAALDEAQETYWSVTTIIKGGLPSPALTAWGMKAVAEYAVANHRTLTEMLKGVTLKKNGGDLHVVSDPNAVQAAIDWLKGSPYRERERKADMGTAVHAAAEAYVLGKPTPDSAPEVRPYVEAFHQFVADWNPRYEMAEASVYNRSLKYAGTLDAIAVVDGLAVTPTRLILDYKTTGSGVYPEAALQLAAYRHAEFVGMPDGTEAPMPEVDGAAVLWLKPGSYEFIPVVTDDSVFRSFRYIMETFRWAEEISRQVIGQALPTPKKEEA